MTRELYRLENSPHRLATFGKKGWKNSTQNFTSKILFQVGRQDEAKVEKLDKFDIVIKRSMFGQHYCKKVDNSAGCFALYCRAL